MYLLAFIYLKYKKSPFIKIGLKKLILKFILGLQFNSFVILISVFAYAILLWVLSLILQTKDESLTNMFIGFISCFEPNNFFNLNGLGGNQFSFASLYFTLAIAGTIIFSISDRYKKQKEVVTQKQLKFAEEYENWYKQHEKDINFDTKNYHKEDRVNRFNSIISTLRETLDLESIDELKALTGYENCLVLIVESFLAGICTLMISQECSEGFFYAFFVFILIFVSLCIYINQVFTDLRSYR